MEKFPDELSEKGVDGASKQRALGDVNRKDIAFKQNKNGSGIISTM